MALASAKSKEEDFDKDELDAKRCASEEKSLLENQDASDAENDDGDESEKVLEK